MGEGEVVRRWGFVGGYCHGYYGPWVVQSRVLTNGGSPWVVQSGLLTNSGYLWPGRQVL